MQPDFITDCGRFAGRVLLKKDIFEGPQTLGVLITDRSNMEQWGNHARFYDTPEDTNLEYATEMLKDNVFRSMELSWARNLVRFIPGVFPGHPMEYKADVGT